MRKLIIIQIFLIFLSGNFIWANKPVTITGKIQFLNTEKFSHFNKVWVVVRENFETRYIDSVSINSDGTWKYTYNGKFPKLLDLDIAKWDRKTVWTDANMFIATRGRDTAKMVIKNPPYVFTEGSDDNNFINLVDHVVYRNYQNMIAISQEQYRAGLSKDTAWVGYLKRLDPYKQLSDDMMQRIKVLVKAYKNRPVVLYGIKYLSMDKEKDLIMPILNDLAAKNKWFTAGAEFIKSYEERIAQQNKLKPGKQMPVVAYNDPDGKPVSIGSYKGKYLLVDFWASWCGPCRQSVPKLKELYKKYNATGFEILSISIDKDEKAWRKAMLEEEMEWKQVLSPDMKETMKLYNFSGIPTLYFVDKEGKIIISTAGYTPDFEASLKKTLNETK